MLHRVLNKLLLCFLFLFLILNFTQCQELKFLENTKNFEEIQASLKYSKETGHYTMKFGEYDTNTAAFAIYKKTLEHTGWDELSISSHEGHHEVYSDFIKTYAMGYLEGVLTAPRIWNHYLNMKTYYFYNTKGEIPEKTREFLNLNLLWMKEKSIEEMNSDPYWYHVNSIVKQMEGLVDGYNSVASQEKQITFAEFQVMNAFGDIPEINYWDPSVRPNFFEMELADIIEKIEATSHCSAFIKLSPDVSNAWFGHNTWMTYSSMTRIFKEYKFISHKKTEKSHAVAFSSYPGTISSVDDFYITDQDLYVTETTNSIFFDKLYEKLTPASNLSWVRAMVANRLSAGGEQWTKIFARYNSGTYNNQFQVLDLKLIDTKSQMVRDNALWIIEQMPGYTESADVTDVLKAQGYWASYNSPYFKTIRETSGYDDMLKKKPELKDAIDYNECVRAKMFRRDQSRIENLDDFKAMMRYNNYKNDPLSKNLPEEAIASRKDLSEENPQCRGATDAKVSSINDIKGRASKTIAIIAGPTSDEQEPFDSATSQCVVSQNKFVFNGIKKRFNYGWIDYDTLLF